MSGLDREIGHLISDILALPERERIKVFEKLREDLELAAPPSEIDKLNERRANAIKILINVAEHLGLDSDEARLAMKLSDFNSAPFSLREGQKASQIARSFFGSWPLAKQAAIGEVLSTNVATQQRRKRLARRRRRFARYQAGLYEWLVDDPAELTQASYDRWRKKRNGALAEGERPFVRAQEIPIRFGKSWDEIVNDAKSGSLVVPELQDDAGGAERLSDDELREESPLEEIETAEPDDLVVDPALFSRRLYAARKARGWTMRELGDRSGVHYSTISMLEGGSRMESPSYAIVVKLAQGLGVSTDYFATEDSRQGLTPSRARAPVPTPTQRETSKKRRSQAKRKPKRG